jgi:CO/xanthine dehydrogenase FAD-binding subunit
MDFLQPRSLAEALEMMRARPGAVPIAGGTDVMVEINFGRHRPPALLDLTHVDELARWEMVSGPGGVEGNGARQGTGEPGGPGRDGTRGRRGMPGAFLRVGACVSYARLITELAGALPGLAMASRTVGSPQIRNRGTLGGNLGSASPAGDTHPVLLASGAVVEAASSRGSRRIPIGDFYTGVKQSALRPGELVTSVLVPAAPGPQQFCKIGTRNAMVIAVASFALELDPPGRRVGTGIGSAAPVPRRAPAAEEFLAGVLAERSLWENPADLEDAVVTRFGELVAAASAPIDDVRGTASYRRHALAVMARRALRWAWQDYTERQWRGGPGQEQRRKAG